jgi:type I restriction enzyme S subunit
MSNKAKAIDMKAEGQPALVPKLRFPEFRDAPGWKEKRFDEVLTPIVRERKKPIEAYTGLGLRSHGKGTFLKKLEDPKKNAMEYLYEVKCDDLIVNITFAWEGAVAIAGPSDDGALVSHRFPTYTFEKGKASHGFFRYIILDKQFVYNLGVISPGGAGRNRVLSKNDFLKLKVLLPDTEEQQKIVDCLSYLDELIAAQARKLDALKTHKNGLLQQLFPREGETQPRLRFPEFQDAGEWEETRLGKMGELVAGLTYSPDDVREHGLLVLRSSNVQNGRIELLDCVYVDPGIKGANLSLPNDILICVRNGSTALIGKSALIPEGMPLCTHGAFMTVFRSQTPRFVFQLFQTSKYQKQVAGDLGATINSINGSQFLRYKFFVPKPPEQQRIADCLTSLDDLIAAHAQKLEALKTHKKGLMQQLFPSPEEGEA